MLTQLSENASSKEIDALEQHLVAQTNQMLEQVKSNQMMMISALMHEIRFTRNLVNQMGNALNE
jgi:hypothetical protein